MTHKFLINEDDATFDDQAEPDSVDFEILLLGHQGTGVKSGCTVTGSSGTDPKVDVASGDVLIAGVEVSVSAQANKTIAAAGSDPRFDMVSINNSGTAIVTTGTASANPVFPSVPANSVAVATVYVPNDTPGELTDETKTVDVLGGAGDADFNLPAGLTTGDKIILFISNVADRSLSTVDAGDTNWTVLQHLIEPPVKIDVITRTLTAGDSKTSVQAAFNGAGDMYCYAYKVTGVDLTAATVATFDDTSTFDQFFQDQNSGDTDPKLWAGFSVKNQTGLTPEAGAFDYSDLNVHDETLTSPAQSIVITAYNSSDQTMFRLQASGPPHWPYLDLNVNDDMASIMMFFDLTDAIQDNQINDKRVILTPASSPSPMYAENNGEAVSVSGSSWAWKGSCIVPYATTSIWGAVFIGTVIDGGTYQAAVITESGGTIATIDKSDTTVTDSTDAETTNGRVMMLFDPPVVLTAGTTYFLLTGRTDAGDSYQLPVQYPGPRYAMPFASVGTNASARVAEANAAVSDTVNFFAGSSTRLGCLFTLD